jgi:hypothetical protein
MKPAKGVGWGVLVSLATVCLAIAVFATLMGFLTWLDIL